MTPAPLSSLGPGQAQAYTQGHNVSPREGGETLSDCSWGEVGIRCEDGRSREALGTCLPVVSGDCSTELALLLEIPLSRSCVFQDPEAAPRGNNRETAIPIRGHLRPLSQNQVTEPKRSCFLGVSFPSPPPSAPPGRPCES